MSERDEKLDALIERVRGLEGADREVDAEIDVFFCIGDKQMRDHSPQFWNGPSVWQTTQRHGICEAVCDYGKTTARWQSEDYTASLDAVVALIERELPGWSWTIESKESVGNEVVRPLAIVWPPHEDPADTAFAETPQLALLLATLSAVKGQPA